MTSSLRIRIISLGEKSISPDRISALVRQGRAMSQDEAVMFALQ
jgi:hypothetical protein